MGVGGDMGEYFFMRFGHAFRGQYSAVGSRRREKMDVRRCVVGA